MMGSTISLGTGFKSSQENVLINKLCWVSHGVSKGSHDLEEKLRMLNAGFESHARRQINATMV